MASGRRSKEETSKLKEYAQTLFIRVGLTQKEVAEKVGISEKTMSQWVDKEGWDKIKAASVMTKEQELFRIYAQINELNSAIVAKPEGQRYANSKEADALKKLTSAAKDLESDLGISDSVNVLIKFLNYLKPIDFEAAKKLQRYSDAYIKSLVS